MNLDALALILMLVLWAALGIVWWLVAAVLRRGQGTLAALPLAAVGGMAGGLLVPALGRRDGVGLALSLVAAVVGGIVLTAAGLRLGR